MSFLDYIETDLKENSNILDCVETSPSGNGVSLSDSEYYQHKDAWSNSMVKELMQDEVSFDEWFRGDIIRPCDDKFARGQYMHDILAKMFSLGEYVSECKFLIIPKLDMRTKAGKEKYAELTNGVNLDEVYCISEIEAKQLEALAYSFYDSPYSDFIKRNFNSVQVEQAYIKYSDKFGLKKKGKLDLEFVDASGHKVVVDWKTSSSFSEFRNKAKWMDYDRQAAWYTDISDADEFYFVVFDVVSMKRFKVYKASNKFLEDGERKSEIGLAFASRYMKEGINSDFFKVGTL